MAARQVHDDQAVKLVDLRTEKLIINPTREKAYQDNPEAKLNENTNCLNSNHVYVAKPIPALGKDSIALAGDEMPPSSLEISKCAKAFTQFACFIEVLLRRHDRVYVYCKNSRSRSPSVLVAFFMLFRRCSLHACEHWFNEAYPAQRPRTATDPTTVSFPQFDKFRLVLELIETAIRNSSNDFYGFNLSRTVEQFSLKLGDKSGSLLQQILLRTNKSPPDPILVDYSLPEDLPTTAFPPWAGKHTPSKELSIPNSVSPKFKTRSQKRAANAKLAEELEPKKFRPDATIKNEPGIEQSRSLSKVDQSVERGSVSSPGAKMDINTTTGDQTITAQCTVNEATGTVKAGGTKEKEVDGNINKMTTELDSKTTTAEAMTEPKNGNRLEVETTDHLNEQQKQLRGFFLRQFYLDTGDKPFACQHFINRLTERRTVSCDIKTELADRGGLYVSLLEKILKKVTTYMEYDYKDGDMDIEVEHVEAAMHFFGFSIDWKSYEDDFNFDGRWFRKLCRDIILKTTRFDLLLDSFRAIDLLQKVFEASIFGNASKERLDTITQSTVGVRISHSKVVIQHQGINLEASEHIHQAGVISRPNSDSDHEYHSIEGDICEDDDTIQSNDYVEDRPSFDYDSNAKVAGELEPEKMMVDSVTEFNPGTDSDRHLRPTFNGRPLVLTPRQLQVGNKIVEGHWPAEIRDDATHFLETRLDLDTNAKINAPKSFLRRMREHPGYMKPHSWPNLSTYFTFHSWFELDNVNKDVSTDNDDSDSDQLLKSHNIVEDDIDDMLIQEASLNILTPERSAVAELSTLNNAFRLDEGKVEYIPLSERTNSASNKSCDQKDELYDKCVTEWNCSQGTECLTGIDEFSTAKRKAKIWLSMLIAAKTETQTAAKTKPEDKKDERVAEYVTAETAKSHDKRKSSLEVSREVQISTNKIAVEEANQQEKIEEMVVATKQEDMEAESEIEQEIALASLDFFKNKDWPDFFLRAMLGAFDLPEVKTQIGFS